MLPDGRSAVVSAGSARLICDRLWDLGLAPGAATAAARITDALLARRFYGNGVAFTSREVPSLFEASEVDALTWSFVARSTLPPISAVQRQHVLAVCDELIERLETGEDQPKLRKLLLDLEELRQRLRSGD